MTLSCEEQALKRYLEKWLIPFQTTQSQPPTTDLRVRKEEREGREGKECTQVVVDYTIQLYMYYVHNMYIQ
jgi:hypothetical protein